MLVLKLAQTYVFCAPPGGGVVFLTRVANHEPKNSTGKSFTQGVRATEEPKAAPTTGMTSAKGAALTTAPAASARRETGTPTAAPTKQPMTKPVSEGA